MKQVNVLEARTHLSQLLARVAPGEEIIIARDGVPVARLCSIAGRKPKIPGRLKGQILIQEDFDAPLPDGFWPGEQ